MRILFIVAAVVAAGWATSSVADSTRARWDVYAAGSDHTDKMLPCTFSQRQGCVTITREDGVTHKLEPIGDAPGNFRDQHDRTVYRQNGFGDQGLIFRFPDESVFVYWSTAPSNPTMGTTQPLRSVPKTTMPLLPLHCCAAAPRTMPSSASAQPASCAWKGVRHRS